MTHGVAGLIGFLPGELGCGRHTVRPFGTGAPGVKQVGKPVLFGELRARVKRWPPLPPARLRRARGSVGVVSAHQLPRGGDHCGGDRRDLRGLEAGAPAIYRRAAGPPAPALGRNSAVLDCDIPITTTTVIVGLRGEDADG